MFQIPDAAADPLTRWAALFSLICSLMSLTYGCVYIVQFGTMRTMYKASKWAEVIAIHPPARAAHLSAFPGSAEDQDIHMVEYLGPSSYAGNMAYLVHAIVLSCHLILRMADRLLLGSIGRNSRTSYTW